jgi:hypothetical protein
MSKIEELKKLVEKLEKDKELFNYLEDKIDELFYEECIFEQDESDWLEMIEGFKQ